MRVHTIMMGNQTNSVVAVIAFVLLTLSSGCAQGKDVKAQNPAQAQIDSLASLLSQRMIGEVEILRIPDRVLTRTRITPEMLQLQYHYRLTIRDVRSGLYQEGLTEAVKSVSARPSADTSDLRWGVIFYDLNGSRVMALYLDRTGKKGAVADTPVLYEGGIYSWLNENFSRSLR